MTILVPKQLLNKKNNSTHFHLRKYYQPISLWNHINAHVHGSKPEKRWTKTEDETSLGVFLLRDLTGPSKMLGHFSWGLQAWCIKKIPGQKWYVENNFLVILYFVVWNLDVFKKLFTLILKSLCSYLRKIRAFSLPNIRVF